MLFTFEERRSDSPFVEGIWRTQSERAGDFTSIAVSHWEMVVMRYHGKAHMTVRGPETKATRLHNSIVGADYFGIIFKLGTVLPYELTLMVHPVVLGRGKRLFKDNRQRRGDPHQSARQQVTCMSRL